MKGWNKSWAMDITNEHVKNVQISTNLISIKSLKQNSSIGDLVSPPVSESISQWRFDFNVFTLIAELS